VEREPQAELPVDLGLVCKAGVAEDRERVAEGGDEVGDLVAGEPVRRRPAVAVSVEVGVGVVAFGGGGGDPAGDDSGVGACFEGGAVAAQFVLRRLAWSDRDQL
jgi:hypothetical protein